MTEASTIRVFSGGATQGAFAMLTPKFEAQSSHKVSYVFEVSAALDARLAAGEKADVLVLPVPNLDNYAKAGRLRAEARATFGSVGVSVAVREGAAKPDISTKEKFREAMLAARSIVHATPGKTPSGTHLGKVMQELGIADAIATKTMHKPALDGGVEVVASGAAEIGIYPASEVAMVKGLAVIGPLPAGIDLTIVYGAAATTGSGDAAAAFVRFMAAPENRAAWKAAGFTPA
jgi:molybdate transport system substrate-binding protein